MVIIYNKKVGKEAREYFPLKLFPYIKFKDTIQFGIKVGIVVEGYGKCCHT